MTTGNERLRVLVTGGSRGIGRAIVCELARRGADVVFTYKSDEESARETAKDASEFGTSITFAQLDVADRDSIDEFARALDDIDAVVLNAGVWAGGRLGVMSEEEWWSVVDTNVRGTYATTRAVLPHIHAGPDASITVVASVVGVMGFPGDTAYASAKGALISFGKSLAKELVRDGIRVNVIAPGFVNTGMTSELSDQGRRKVMSEIPLGRAGTPEEIAKGVSFLVFDGTYMTGSILTIDGGWSAR